MGAASHIKVRAPGDKRFGFPTPGGGVNHLRVHAARFDTAEKAQALIDANKDDNPGWDWKVVPALNGGARG